MIRENLVSVVSIPRPLYWVLSFDLWLRSIRSLSEIGVENRWSYQVVIFPRLFWSFNGKKTRSHQDDFWRKYQGKRVLFSFVSLTLLLFWRICSFCFWPSYKITEGRRWRLWSQIIRRQLLICLSLTGVDFHRPSPPHLYQSYAVFF